MYRIRSITADQWEIVDSHARLVFVGTKRQAEDWLDHQDNQRPRRAARVAWLLQPFSTLHRFIFGFRGMSNRARAPTLRELPADPSVNIGNVFDWRPGPQTISALESAAAQGAFMQPRRDRNRLAWDWTEQPQTASRQAK